MKRPTIGIFTWTLVATLSVVFAFAGFAAPRASAAGVPYVVGDVFAGQNGDVIKHFSPTGVLLDTLHTTFNTETGMCFGEMGRLRSTNFGSNNMTLFDNMGNVIPPNPWVSGLISSPESCVLDASGAIYVGTADGARDIYKFDTSGNLLAQYNPVVGPRGTDWIDLASDQCTMYYTSEGDDIRRFDVCTNTQLTNFATNFTVGTDECYALRIRTNGEVMVACTDRVYRLSPTGTVMQMYLASTYGSTFLFALNLDPDGTSFWTADINTGRIHRIEINTGVQLTTFLAGGGAVFGLAIFGEITAARPPASLTLDPKTRTNPVGTQHCVTATVRDAAGQPLEDVTVVFTVNGTAGNSASGSAETDANGEAVFCYQGPNNTGIDAIRAFADADDDGMQDAGEPFDVAEKTWAAGEPATLILTPPAATNPVGAQHCVTATVRDAFGNPVPGVTVYFSVEPGVPMTTTFPTPPSGSDVTDANGEAEFCYTASLPGVDRIEAYADTNSNGVQDPGEPSGEATKTWTPPLTTQLCEVKITDGGWIIANNLDRASFGGNANSLTGPVKGEQQYSDHGPLQPMTVHSIELTAITCNDDRTTASIFGRATIDGTGDHFFRIDVTDMSKTGGSDSYGISLDTGYMSGQKVLSGGQITIH